MTRQQPMGASNCQWGGVGSLTEMYVQQCTNEHMDAEVFFASCEKVLD